MNCLFVEGNDDGDFVKSVFNAEEKYKVIEYSRLKNEKVNSLIKSVHSTRGKYIMLADLDGKTKDSRIKELTKKYKELNSNNIFFSIQEIEAWYLSGVSDNVKRKYNIKEKYLNDTQSITKERFEYIFRDSRESLLIIKLNILNDYDIENAKSRNASFNTFLESAI